MTTSAASVPGSLPVHATDSWMEGVLVPPIKLYDKGKLNEAAFRIITRNSRLSEHLAGDMDAEIGAARLGSRRIVALAERYGVDTLEAAFEQILSNTAEIFRREILPKIKDGVYHFEDYIEADGVDAPRLHALRLTMTKTPEKIVLDFTGTDPEAKGPINWALDEVEGRYFRKWLAPTLRSLAATPERAAEIDSNEGVLEVIDVVFPRQGHADHADLQQADRDALLPDAALARRLRRLPVEGDRRPHARRPRDDPHLGPDRRPDAARISTSSARCSAAAARAGRGRTAPTSSTSCPTPRTCPPNSPRPATRSWSSSSG